MSDEQASDETVDSAGSSEPTQIIPRIPSLDDEVDEAELADEEAELADEPATEAGADADAAVGVAVGVTTPPTPGRNRSKAVLASRVTLLCALGAIIAIAAAGVTWVISPGWGGGHGTITTITRRNIGEIPTAPIAGIAAISISPNRIEIPRIAAVAPIVTVATSADRELGVPLDPKIVGWWNGGARPGAKKGTAILDGHINYSGVAGVLANIGTLNPGDTVFVFGLHNGRQTKLTFSITGVRTYDKAALPYRDIFDQNSVGRLAIVTCGGPFDASTGNYRDNIVAFAIQDLNAT